MRKFILILVTVLSLGFVRAQTSSFHDFSAPTIFQDTISMSRYYGKKLMVVNTASLCAYTPQFGDLETLYTDYQQYGFEIIGFPCNDFANQDPHDDSTINEFCTGNYNVTFQMMSKVHTVSGNIDPIYQWLQQQSLNGVANATVSWNFNKFLIDEAGHWVKHYNQNTLPNDPEIVSWIVDTPSVVSSIKNDVNDILEMRSANPGNVIEFAFTNSKPLSLNIDLFNSNGQIAKKLYSGTSNNSQIISHDVSQLPTGVYVIRITGAGLQRSMKYVLVR
ncbi:MAG TPA: T9SS type A sorting domain-containing protein [Chitinophagales bacterium]|nr:T9SS type A sorting domain-containing protein [Chitinophagales bacterium]